MAPELIRINAPSTAVILVFGEFNNGQVAEIGEAVRVMGKEMLNLELEDEEVEDIVAFMLALSGEIPAFPVPSLP